MRSVLANFVWLSLGDTGSRVLLFAATLYLGTTLGREEFGRVSFAQAIVVYFLWLVNLGLPLVGARAAARDRSTIERLAGSILVVRLGLAAIALLLLFLLTLAVGQLAAMRGLVLAFGLWLAPAAMTLDWVFQGIENTRPTGLARLADRLVYAVLIVLLVHGAGDVQRVPWAWVAGAATGMGVLAYAYRRAGWRLRVPRSWGALGAGSLLRSAWPFALSFLAIQIYLSLDTVMIGFLRAGPGVYAEVGAYSAAYKIVQFLLAFAALTGAVLFPVLARLGAASEAAMQPVVRAASRLTLAVGLPLAAGGMLLAEPLMGLAWGEEFRAASAAPFAILVWSVATVFANVPYATILLATGRETRYLRAVGAGAALNVLANFVLIPRFGLRGAAAATIASEAVVLSLYIIETRSIVHHQPAADLWRPLAAAALMAGVVLRLGAHPAVAGAAGAAVYIVVCAGLGQVGRADLAVLRRHPPASPPPRREENQA